MFWHPHCVSLTKQIANIYFNEDDVMNSLKRIFVSIKSQIDHVADEFENHEALLVTLKLKLIYDQD